MSIAEAFSYDFAVRGLVAGMCVAVACSLLGVVLVLRRLSLIGDGLSHVAFLGVALGLLLRAHPVLVSLPVVMASSLGIFRLMARARLYGDAAIGMVSSFGVAGGILLASMGGGFNVDIFSYLFGSILSIGTEELYLSAGLAAGVVVAALRYYRELMSVAFDEDFARASGINTGCINAALVLVTSAAVVLAIRVVGVMLTSALIVIPAVTAIQLARGFRSTMVAAALVGAFSVVAGLFASFAFDLPAGAVIVMVNLAAFFFAAALKRFLKPVGGATAGRRK